jgi:hypothetical protein
MLHSLEIISYAYFGTEEIRMLLNNIIIIELRVKAVFKYRSHKKTEFFYMEHHMDIGRGLYPKHI